MKYLGIDYGTKYIGLALSDESGRVAFPFAVIKNTADAANDVLGVVESKRVKMIVLGEIGGVHSLHNYMQKKMLKFKRVLIEKTGLSVVLQEEAYTTFEARRKKEFRHRGILADNRKNEIKTARVGRADDKAAALILQRYLDFQNYANSIF